MKFVYATPLLVVAAAAEHSADCRMKAFIENEVHGYKTETIGVGLFIGETPGTELLTTFTHLNGNYDETTTISAVSTTKGAISSRELIDDYCNTSYQKFYSTKSLSCALHLFGRALQLQPCSSIGKAVD